MKVVKFLQAWSVYTTTDTAGFADETADKLIKAGICEEIEGDEAGTVVQAPATAPEKPAAAKAEKPAAAKAEKPAAAKAEKPAKPAPVASLPQQGGGDAGGDTGGQG